MKTINGQHFDNIVPIQGINPDEWKKELIEELREEDLLTTDLQAELESKQTTLEICFTKAFETLYGKVVGGNHLEVYVELD